MLTHESDEASYPLKLTIEVPMELLVTWNNDRYIIDHRRWGRDFDTMNRYRNRRSFHMGGHGAHFWEVTNAGRCVKFVSSIMENSDTPSTCFGMDLLGVPAPDVYTIYAVLISSGDQTGHKFVVRDRSVLKSYLIRTYRKGTLLTLFEVAAHAQTCYRTLVWFFCSALFFASYAFYDSALHTDWGRFVGFLCPPLRVFQ